MSLSGDQNRTLHDLVRALDGDPDGLNDLLDRYGVRLRATIITAGVHDGVDDVTQNALLNIANALLEDRFTLQTVEQFRAWAETIARNCARDALRQDRRRAQHVRRLPADDRNDAGADSLADPHSTPSRYAPGREELSRLRTSFSARCARVAKLRELDQKLVWMHERHGMTFVAIARELAAETGRPVTRDALRMRYSRLCDRIGPAPGPVPDSWFGDVAE